MNVLVTGGSGFLGRNLLPILQAGGHRYFVSLHRHFDLTHPHAADTAVNAARDHFGGQLDVLVHCAATVGGIGLNLRRPAQLLADNVLMNTNIVRSARRYGVRHFIGIGSVCGYPHTPHVIPFVEEEYFGNYPEPTNGYYGYAKRLHLLHLQAEHAQYGLEWSYLIPANLYGPGETFGAIANAHVIPALFTKFLGPGPVKLWGTGSATRDFLYVDDAAHAICQAIEVGPIKTPINIGSGVETSIADLADAIADLTEYTGPIEWDETMPDGQPRRVLDITKAGALLNWNPGTTLETGLYNVWHSLPKGMK